MLTAVVFLFHMCKVAVGGEEGNPTVLQSALMCAVKVKCTWYVVLYQPLCSEQSVLKLVGRRWRGLQEMCTLRCVMCTA